MKQRQKKTQPVVGAGVQTEENRVEDQRTFRIEKGRIMGIEDFSLSII